MAVLSYITGVAPYRSALAFDYCIVDQGRIVRASYVLMHPLRGETVRSLERWVEGWLRVQAGRLALLPPDDPTEILRPNAAGDATILTPVGAASNWDCVDEATADDDTTYVKSTNTAEETDYYNLQATALTDETVDSVDVWHRSRGNGANGGRSRGGVRLSASDTQGTLRSLVISYTDFEDVALARPGGGSWAVGDLNALQILIAARVQAGGESSEGRVTQGYVEINYTAAGQPYEVRDLVVLPGFGPGAGYVR